MTSPSMEERIRSKLEAAFQPEHLVIENESHGHSGPGTETHFKLTLVSDSFESLSPVKRHQAVYQCLSEELASGVHALAIHTFAPAQWAASGNVPASPACRGGS